MAPMRSLTDVKVPRRIAWRVMIEKKISTMFSHEPEVGVNRTGFVEARLYSCRWRCSCATPSPLQTSARCTVARGDRGYASVGELEHHPPGHPGADGVVVARSSRPGAGW